MSSIYGEFLPYMEMVMDRVGGELEAFDRSRFEETGEHAFEHFTMRIKSDESMREKCRRKKLPETPHSALREVQDSIGIRIVTAFRDDIQLFIDLIRSMKGVEIVEEVDYIRHAKSNGYRSYHMILLVTSSYPDVDGNTEGKYYVEVQLRTIAMDSWASLEHKMSYKKDVRNKELIISELKRCADELAACDVSMQTIRNMINESN